ncbi:unnamed protein product [Mucor hiemalis]
MTAPNRNNKVFNNVQRETLLAITDTFVARLSDEEEEQLIANILKRPNNCYSREQLQAYAKTDSSSLNIIDRIEKRLLETLDTKKISDFAMLLTLLSYRPSSILFTGTWTLFKDLKRSDREKILVGWRKSSLATFSKQLYNAFMGLSMLESYIPLDSQLYERSVYPGIEGGHSYFKKQPDYTEVRHERLHMLTTEEAKTIKKVDVIIVGSGAGGGTTAAELAKTGLSVLVIEKGKYFHEDDMVPDNDAYAFKNLYNNGGTSPNAANTINFISGSNFGGGTTINYLASIGPQEYVKKQWARKGLPYFTSQEFEDDINTVCERIGASKENIKHSGQNKKLLDGCSKLGYHTTEIPQNTSGRPHHCGKCYTGCSSGIKNSTTNTWLKDAASHGAQFLDSTQVTRVLVKNGKAFGVACKVHGSEKEERFYANAVVVSGGALHTPGILLNSGLTNPNIGKDLRLHLSVLVIGLYDDVINPTEGSLLTAVCDGFDNFDGTSYGFKVECFNSGFGFFACMVPFEGSAKHKETVLKHRNAVTTFGMTRDKDSHATVKYDAFNKVDIDFNISKRDGNSLVESLVQMARIQVAAGARELHCVQHRSAPFVFNDDEESRVDNPRFLEWIKELYKLGPPIPSTGHQMASW